MWNLCIALIVSRGDRDKGLNRYRWIEKHLPVVSIQHAANINMLSVHFLNARFSNIYMRMKFMAERGYFRSDNLLLKYGKSGFYSVRCRFLVNNKERQVTMLLMHLEYLNI